MVKKLSQIYLDARKLLMTAEDPQTASYLARNLICHVTGKTQEQFLADREMYASDEVCGAMDAAVGRLLAGEPLANGSSTVSS